LRSESTQNYFQLATSTGDALGHLGASAVGDLGIYNEAFIRLARFTATDTGSVAASQVAIGGGVVRAGGAGYFGGAIRSTVSLELSGGTDYLARIAAAGADASLRGQLILRDGTGTSIVSIDGRSDSALYRSYINTGGGLSIGGISDPGPVVADQVYISGGVIRAAGKIITASTADGAITTLGKITAKAAVPASFADLAAVRTYLASIIT